MVSGAVFADTFIIQQLTDYITLGLHPTHPDRGLHRVAQVLVALKECIKDLCNFYKKLMDTPPVTNSRVAHQDSHHMC